MRNTGPDRVLVVDDEKTNRRVLGDLLKEDHTVLLARDGEQALRQAAGDPPPDLILLDVLMPDMDGYEVLRRLKADVDTSHIPVMFVTGLTDEADEQKGLDLGAVDYVSKPFRPAVIRARVRNQLELKHHRAELLQAEKMAALAHLVAGVAHEINTPVGTTLTAASHILDQTGALERQLADGSLRRSDLRAYLESVRDAAELVQSNTNRTASLIGSFREVAVDQTQDERRGFDLCAYLHEAGDSLRPRLERAGHAIRVACDETIPCDSYPAALFRILSHLVDNATAHAYAEGEAGTLAIAGRRVDDGTAEIVFSDTGCGMDAGDRERAFEPFYTNRRGEGHSGLGLHIVFNLVTRILGGSVGLHSTPGEGTTVRLRLPTTVDAGAGRG